MMKSAMNKFGSTAVHIHKGIAMKPLPTGGTDPKPEQRGNQVPPTKHSAGAQHTLCVLRPFRNASFDQLEA